MFKERAGTCKKKKSVKLKNTNGNIPKALLISIKHDLCESHRRKYPWFITI